MGAHFHCFGLFKEIMGLRGWRAGLAAKSQVLSHKYLNPGPRTHVIRLIITYNSPVSKDLKLSSGLCGLSYMCGTCTKMHACIHIKKLGKI